MGHAMLQRFAHDLVKLIAGDLARAGAAGPDVLFGDHVARRQISIRHNARAGKGIDRGFGIGTGFGVMQRGMDFA